MYAQSQSALKLGRLQQKITEIVENINDESSEIACKLERLPIATKHGELTSSIIFEIWI
jgi:hypothetical protein